jgi:hypothetical protein
MMSLFSIRSILAVVSVLVISSATSIADEKPISVNVSNFVRAETDRYFSNAAKEGAFGTLRHRREAIAIDHEDVIWMNRDTLYSHGVFDLDAALLSVTLPESPANASCHCK